MKIGILLFFSCLTAQAQSFKEQYESFKKQAIRQYSDFRNQANDDYARFLRAAWQYYKEMPVVEQPQEVPVPPVVYEDDGENEATPLPYDTIVLNTEPQPQPQPISPIEEKEGNDRLVSFSFYGTCLVLK